MITSMRVGEACLAADRARDALAVECSRAVSGAKQVAEQAARAEPLRQAYMAAVAHELTLRHAYLEQERDRAD